MGSISSPGSTPRQSPEGEGTLVLLESCYKSYERPLTLSWWRHAPKARPKWPTPQAGHLGLTRVSPCNDVRARAIRTYRGHTGADPRKPIERTLYHSTGSVWDWWRHRRESPAINSRQSVHAVHERRHLGNFAHSTGWSLNNSSPNQRRNNAERLHCAKKHM